MVPRLYLVLAALRCCLLFAPGYVHPDEFFQGGQELLAGLLLGVPGCLVPWEFRPQHAVRSVAFPCVRACVRASERVPASPC
jgi:GPI mannosyltransferase 4